MNTCPYCNKNYDRPYQRSNGQADCPKCKVCLKAAPLPPPPQPPNEWELAQVHPGFHSFQQFFKELYPTRSFLLTATSSWLPAWKFFLRGWETHSVFSTPANDLPASHEGYEETYLLDLAKRADHEPPEYKAVEELLNIANAFSIPVDDIERWSYVAQAIIDKQNNPLGKIAAKPPYKKSHKYPICDNCGCRHDLSIDCDEEDEE